MADDPRASEPPPPPAQPPMPPADPPPGPVPGYAPPPAQGRVERLRGLAGSARERLADAGRSERLRGIAGSARERLTDAGRTAMDAGRAAAEVVRERQHERKPAAPPQPMPPMQPTPPESAQLVPTAGPQFPAPTSAPTLPPTAAPASGAPVQYAEPTPYPAVPDAYAEYAEPMAAADDTDQPRRPPAVLVAAVLAYVQALLVLVSAVPLLLIAFGLHKLGWIHHLVTEWLKTPTAAEFTAMGIANIVLGVALVAGGVLFTLGRDRRVLLGSSAVCALLTVYWVVVSFFCVATFAVLPIVSVALMFLGGARAWVGTARAAR